MAAWILAAMTLLGIALVLVMFVAQWRQLRSVAAAIETAGPPISILKPLKGVDPDLEANLESFFCLDYPEYELLFAVADPCDPAIVIVEKVAARHPGVRSNIVVGGSPVGFNPKVNNLATIEPHAAHDLLLISDSSVAAAPSMLRHMVALIDDEDVGLVTSFIRGAGGRGLGGALESLQLNTFVMGGVAAVSGPLRRACAVGKSMLFRRGDLMAVGGFTELARYLAEDQVFAEKTLRRGRGVRVCPHPVDDVLGRVTVRGFVARHLRWARIRRHISMPGYVGELFTNPLMAAAALLVAAPSGLSVALAALTFTVVCATSYTVERQLDVRRPLLHYPLLVFLRSVAVFLTWPVPLVSSSVTWRGRRFRITSNTLLEPEPPQLGFSEEPELTAEEVAAA